TGVKTTDDVKTAVINYLQRNGVTNCDNSMVTITNLTSSSRNDPSTANQLDHYQVKVSVPVDNFRWILLSRLTSGTNLTATVDWYSMRDLPLTVNDAIPLQ